MLPSIPEPIQELLDVVAHWHRYLRGEAPDALDELLDDDAVMVSPVVFTPQRGTAVLEFETTMGGKYVNGVDMIQVRSGRITEFRVMIRPLQAVHTVHDLMGAHLAAAHEPG